MKLCTSCSVTKSSDAFHRHKSGANGLRSTCKICTNLLNKDYYSNLDQETKRAKWRAYYWKNPEKYRLKSKNKDKIKAKSIYYRSRLKTSYGITPEDRLELLKKQEGKCAICRSEYSDSRNRNLAIDHCHTTKKVRGLLCSNCNNGLGRFKDNVILLQNAIAYLGKSL